KRVRTLIVKRFPPYRYIHFRFSLYRPLGDGRVSRVSVPGLLGTSPQWSSKKIAEECTHESRNCCVKFPVPCQERSHNNRGTENRRLKAQPQPLYPVIVLRIALVQFCRAFNRSLLDVLDNGQNTAAQFV